MCVCVSEREREREIVRRREKEREYFVLNVASRCMPQQQTASCCAGYSQR